MSKVIVAYDGNIIVTQGSGPQGIQGPTGETGLPGGQQPSFETVSQNLDAFDKELVYNAGVLTSIVYSNGITKTLNYDAGVLTSIVLSGATPDGISLTKYLSYDLDGALDEVTYYPEAVSQPSTNLADIAIKEAYERVANAYTDGDKANTLSQTWLQAFQQHKTVRLLHTGTSIAAATNGATLSFGSTLVSVFGDSGNESVFFGGLGGSYTEPSLGWYKQPYCGASFIRARGDSGSQTISYTKYCKRIVLRYSQESDGAAFVIRVDGAETAVTSNGVNALGVTTEINVDIGIHTIEIVPPASGYAYIEGIEFCQDKPGVHLINTSLGGASLSRHIYNDVGVYGSSLPAAQTTGFTGIDSAFMGLEPDVILSTFTVNDAGKLNGASLFSDAVDRVVDQVNVPLLWICEPSGHYALTGDANREAYYQIKSKILSLDCDVLDWDTLMGSDASRYYQATNIDDEAGTFDGDYIHPLEGGQSILGAALFAMTGINSSGYVGTSYSAVLELSNPEPKVPLGESDSEVLAGVIGLQKILTNTVNQTQSAVILSPSMNALSRIFSPCWYAADEMDYGVNFNALILAAGTSNDYGPYKDCAAAFAYELTPTFEATRTNYQPYTLTIIAEPLDGYIKIKVANEVASGNVAMLVDGVRVAAPTGTIDIPAALERPRLIHITFDPNTADDLKIGLQLSGRIYRVYLTATDYACIPGRINATANYPAPEKKMIGEIDDPIIGQTYFEEINGKTITKVCRGTGVYRPLEDKFSAYYDMIDPGSAVFYYKQTPNEHVWSAYNPKYGAPTFTFSRNPNYFEGNTGNRFDVNDAGHTYTVVCVCPSERMSIMLYSSGTNVYKGLDLDGNWTTKANIGSGTDIFTGKGTLGHRMCAFTFTLPDASTMTALGNCFMRLVTSGTANIWVCDPIVVEGSSAILRRVT